jgi:hypothetical protein
MTATAGVICHKVGFGCTVVDAAGDAVDHDLEVPASIKKRGEALAWIADEAKRLVEMNGIEVVALQKSGAGKFGASPERHEVEGAVQIGFHQAGAECRRLNREQVRAAMGVEKAKGAYEGLLRRADVKARSNATRRDQFLLALSQHP